MTTCTGTLVTLHSETYSYLRPMNIDITLISSVLHKLESLRYISAADGSIFIHILVMGSERQAHNVTE